jgi:hypothetical protein
MWGGDRVTPSERYKHLQIFWQNRMYESKSAYDQAIAMYNLWSQKLIEAEIAEKLAKENE